MSGHQSTALLCRYRCRLLLAEIPKGVNRNSELKQRLQQWESGQSSGSERAGRPAEPSSQYAQIRTLLDRQKERILAECQAEIKRHEFQADYDRRSLRKLGEIIESQQEERHCARA